jgi:CO/xanthine dehydrogenase Mo-binding subunit
MAGTPKRRGVGVSALFYGVDDPVDRPEIFVANVELTAGAAATLHLDVDEIDREAELELSAIVSDELGVATASVRVLTRPDGEHGERLRIGKGGFVPQQAVRDACRDARAQVLARARARLDGDAAGLQIAGSEIRSRGGAGATVSLASLIDEERALGRYCLGWGWQERLPSRADPLSSQGFTFDGFQWMTQCAEVEVDDETGAVELRRWALALCGQTVGPRRAAGSDAACDEPLLFELAGDGSRLLEAGCVWLHRASSRRDGGDERDAAAIPIATPVLGAVLDAVGVSLSETPPDAEAILAVIRAGTARESA